MNHQQKLMKSGNYIYRLDELGLTVKTLYILREVRIVDVDHLTYFSADVLLNLRYPVRDEVDGVWYFVKLGFATLNEIRNRLGKHGLKLRGD